MTRSIPDRNRNTGVLRKQGFWGHYSIGTVRLCGVSLGLSHPAGVQEALPRGEPARHLGPPALQTKRGGTPTGLWCREAAEGGP